MGFRVGVDIGGSFTDFAVFDEETGRLEALKVFSRPDEPGSEILYGLSELERRNAVPPERISYFTHGTTVGVNTVIQRKGLKLALFVTEGFADVLELARLKSPDMYNLFSRRPEPMVERRNVRQIHERMAADGTVVAAVDRHSVGQAYQAALAAGCQGIVVSLLHSYKNAANELQVEALLQEMGCALPVFLSHRVWPVIREFERTTNAVINGYVQPQVAHYLTSMQEALETAGVKPGLLVAKSNGGVMTAEQGKSESVQMILSGTASGVIGAAYLSHIAGVPKVISLDIGGTSADVALILDGSPQYGVGEVIGDFQIHIPSVSVTSIGDGGGSIAWLDEHGVLKVGPHSAGSTPGPACYGRGGDRATITDSFVVSGLLGFDDIGYSAVQLDLAAARRVIAPLAQRIGKTLEETSEAIRSICVSGMYTGVSAVISRFGIDPSEFTLLAFGGAGPMMAAFLARELGMPEVLVPPRPGVLSALGGLVADLKNDFIRTLYANLDLAVLPALRENFTQLRDKGARWLSEEQNYQGTPRFEFLCDMCYVGQSFEVEVPVEEAWIVDGNLAVIADSFHRQHQRLFGHMDRDATVQLVNLRLIVTGHTPKPQFQRTPLEKSLALPSGAATVWLDGRFREAGVYRRGTLCAGAEFIGPAIVTQDDTTTVVPPGCPVRIDEFGNLRITIVQAGDQA